MTLRQHREAAIAAIKLRIRNGHITERALARLTRISQPQVHNVLKGARKGSLEQIDRMYAAADASIDDQQHIASSGRIAFAPAAERQQAQTLSCISRAQEQSIRKRSNAAALAGRDRAA